MKITGVDVAGADVPLADDFPVSYEEHVTTDHVFVRLQTDGDLVGYGEGTALPWFTGETTDSMVAFVERWLVPRIEGRTANDAAAELESFANEFPGNPGAKAAVELALLDLRGKAAGVPVRDLLGPTVRETLPLVFPIPGWDAAKAGERTEAAVEEGFRRFKIKATGDVPADLDRINAVLEQLPDGATARIDANTGWREVPRAANAVAGIEYPERVEFLEQPIRADRPTDLRELWRETGIAVFGDEVVHGPTDVERLGREGLAAGCQLKLAKTGSLVEMSRMAATARSYDLAVTPVSAFGTSLEATAICHLGATIPNLSLACELDPGLIAEDPTTAPLSFAPEIPVPDGPGLGVELSASVFER